MNLDILYRGELSSCNYGCPYCPFAKREDSATQLQLDRAQVERFTQWVGGRTDDSMGILFTPWGEALIRPWYQDAMAALSRMAQVRRVAIQTNLSCKLDWVAGCNLETLALWCTYHPGETTRAAFVGQCRRLDALGVRYSVGVVGLKEHFAEIEALRSELKDDVYLWVNAYKRDPSYYMQDDIDRLAQTDPLFDLNNKYHPSRGRACRTGRDAITVDGGGDIRRCHFVKEILGNIYTEDWEHCLVSRPCPQAVCGCHIGYAHLQSLQLVTIFGQGILERIPAGVPSRRAALQCLENAGQ